MSWRETSREVIQSVIADNPGVSVEELKRRISLAYPFGERAMTPYKIWLAEVKKALPRSAKQITYEAPRFEMRDAPEMEPRFFLDVDCNWRHQCKGCLICGPMRDQIRELLANPDFMPLLEALRENPNDLVQPLVIADWLDEHKLEAIGELFRSIDAIPKKVTKRKKVAT